MKKALFLTLILLCVSVNCYAWGRGTWAQEDSVGTLELDDGTDTPSAGECVAVSSTDTSKLEYVTCGVGGGLSDVVDDVTPQLGGNLDAQTFNITDVGSLGVATTSTDKALEVNVGTNDALRVTYNDSNGSATNYTDLSTNSSGNFVIVPSGGGLNLDSGTATDSTLKMKDASGDYLIFSVSGLTADRTLTFPDAAGEVSVLGQTITDSELSITDDFSFAIKSPTAETIRLKKMPYAFTATDIDCIVDPDDTGESVTIDVKECDSTGDNCTTLDATIACDNDGAADDGSLSNGLIDSGDWVAVTTSSVTGTVGTLTVTVKGTR